MATTIALSNDSHKELIMLKVEDLRTESEIELESKLKNMRKKFMELRFSHASGTLKNPIEINAMKKDIARIMTVINEKKNEQK